MSAPREAAHALEAQERRQPNRVQLAAPRLSGPAAHDEPRVRTHTAPARTDTDAPQARTSRDAGSGAVEDWHRREPGRAAKRASRPGKSVRECVVGICGHFRDEQRAEPASRAVR